MSEESVIEALEDMCWQFAYKSVVGGKRVLATGGLSALEHAFEELDWKNPHVATDAPGCDAEGCENWITSGTPAADGRYRHFCSVHLGEWKRVNAEWQQKALEENETAAGDAGKQGRLG